MGLNSILSSLKPSFRKPNPGKEACFVRCISASDPITVSPYASPAQQTDFRGLPPCFTFVGDGEPFYSETLQYVENLRAAGIEAEADVFHTDMHAFDMLRPEDPVSREAIRRFHARFEHALFAASRHGDGSI